MQAVFEECVEGILTVFGGKDTLQRDFFGLFKRNEQTFRTILYQVLVGIFTFGAEVYQAATVDPRRRTSSWLSNRPELSSSTAM